MVVCDAWCPAGARSAGGESRWGGVLRAGCWSTPTTRGRRSTGVGKCRRCCSLEITPKVAAWRREQSLLRTLRRRPDLLKHWEELGRTEEAGLDSLV